MMWPMPLVLQVVFSKLKREAALWEFKSDGIISTSGKEVPFWLLLLGGLGIVTGLSLLGYKVMQTIGHKITKLTHSRGTTDDNGSGYSAQLATAFTVMLSSFFSLPVSSTHILVGSVTG